MKTLFLAIVGFACGFIGMKFVDAPGWGCVLGGWLMAAYFTMRKE